MTGIWVAADTITAARMNEKTVIQATGATIFGLTTYAGMLAFCTSTGSGFTINHLYERNQANSAWFEIPVIQTTPATSDIIYFDGTNFALRKPNQEILDNHIAGGTESTYTFTPGSALSFDIYSEIYIEMDGAPSASLALLLTINGIGGTAYSYNGLRYTGAATANITASGTANIPILSATAITGTSDEFYCQIYIAGHDVGVTETMLMQSRCSTDSSRITEFINGVEGTDINNQITSITIATSTSTWAAGTRITMYGLRRV